MAYNLEKLDSLINAQGGDRYRFGIAAFFLLLILLFVSSAFGLPFNSLLVIAAVIGGYMALNIGANDVANNVGPAVGAQAMTLASAVLIAAVFEAGGAFIAGGDVVSTIKKGIIDPAMIKDSMVFIWVMMAALLAAAIWLNIATWVGAPVSTTHSIVGGVLGAGIAAGGWGIANWAKMSQIAASWVISPVLGGLIAASFLYLIKRTVLYRRDKIAAAQKVVPILMAMMAWAFSTYLILKGLKKLWKFDFMTASLIGLGIAIAIYIITKPRVKVSAEKLENKREDINALFVLPLIFSAALLSFAHGANDVANAVGPLAAINDAIFSGDVSKKAAIPFWVMAVGALGIAVGLALFGPKLIKTVGSQITELDKIRAFCVAMAAAITVIIASQLGLPVSSTHIAVGGVFGVGFLREYLESNNSVIIHEIEEHHKGEADDTLQKFLKEFEVANLEEKGLMLKALKKDKDFSMNRKERKRLKKLYGKELVQRSMLYKIAAAWIITVPAAATMSAMIYFMIRGMMMPY